MYSRGHNGYGQQPYAGQSAYGQNLSGFSASSVGGAEEGSELSLAARTMLGVSREGDGGRANVSAAGHYGGQYGSLYSSATFNSGQQVSALSTKGVGSTGLEGQSSYTLAAQDSPKLASSAYATSSGQGYGHRSDQLYAEKIPDYPAVERQQYGERQSSYLGRDLQLEPSRRYGDSASYGQHQSEIYDRMDQAILLRQEQMRKTQLLQSASADGVNRQVDYLAARVAASHRPTHDLLSYGGRMEADPRSLSSLTASTYNGQHTSVTSSVLGTAPQRNEDDLLYTHSSSNPGYGVSLPPGRDYATGKGLHLTSLESDYPLSIASRGANPRSDDRKDDKAGYLREFELREEERRREHLHREKDRERERLRERERERERERVRQREREWERERERDREREHILERREKERERERKRALEAKRERTPPRVSRDRRGPSLMREGRSLRQESPCVEATHRRHSPIKERREYVCKVSSASFVDSERDYMSIDKRYPRLYISPECSKVIVNWPKENLKLSFHTPVSFEHDFIEDSVSQTKELSTRVLAEEPVKPGHGSTVWNAKMILMSGLSNNALEELSSQRSSDDRLPHICNILRFAVLRNDRSFMAVGGQWDPIDGCDPSVDGSSLIQTALRYAKDASQLDLQNCSNWNRFLEIHYDRVGKDGLFSHKEVTVLFLPDLSECLPSLDKWRAQWFAHKKAVAERELLLSLKKERAEEKKEGPKDKKMDSSKNAKKLEKSEQVKESASSGLEVNAKKKEKDDVDVKENETGQNGEGSDQIPYKKNEGVIIEEDKIKEQGGVVGAPTAINAKPAKKKIIKKIVKQKVVDKTAGPKIAASKQTEKPDGNDVGEKNVKPEITGQQDGSSAVPAAVKTFTRKKVIKKVPVVKADQSDGKGTQPEVKTEEMDCSDDKLKGKSDSGTAPAVQNSGVKTTIKKKIIKKVIKRKVVSVGANKGEADAKKDIEKDDKMEVQTVNQDVLKQTADTENLATEANNAEKKVTLKLTSEAPAHEKMDSVNNSSKIETTVDKDGKKNEKVDDKKNDSKAKVEGASNKKKIPQKNNDKKEQSKDEKGKKDVDMKNGNKSKVEKEREKRKTEDPPRHPGFILQTKEGKDSKLRSSSLSLDSLLSYTDNDLEESTFEISLFAESLYEMLQYQMGCRLYTFLQKLRIKFVTKRNQRKRPIELPKDGDDKKSATKRIKTGTLPVKFKPTNSEPSGAAEVDDQKMKESADTSIDPPDNVKPENEKYDDGEPEEYPDEELKASADPSIDHPDDGKPENETDDDGEPEEDPEEDEEMEDATAPDKSSKEDENKEGNANEEAETGKDAEETKDQLDESAEEKTDAKVKATKTSSDANTENETSKNVDMKEETGPKEAAVDKELLQAFRFFDRNQVGYIRVEDMRLIIHNLGKFLSHRDVKELVQSALLESNTGRDDQILYNKLLKLSL